VNHKVAVVSGEIFQLKRAEFRAAKATAVSGENQAAIAPAQKSVRTSEDDLPNRRSKKRRSTMSRHTQGSFDALPGSWTGKLRSGVASCPELFNPSAMAASRRAMVATRRCLEQDARYI